VSKRAGAIDRLHLDVDAARDAFYQSPPESSELGDKLDAWKTLADRLWQFETREGMRPVYRGPQPYWLRPGAR
jgi:hypothetical protein